MALWAYFLENKVKIYTVNNRPLFELVQECKLTEDSIYIDDVTGGRDGLQELFGVVQTGDVVMVRSLIDLADDGAELVGVLRMFERIGVEVVAVSETWYEHKTGLVQVESVVGMVQAMADKKRRLGMERARTEGRMGRKMDGRKTEQMRKLRAAGLTVQEIAELCGVSRSTYYRRVGKK